MKENTSVTAECKADETKTLDFSPRLIFLLEKVKDQYSDRKIQLEVGKDTCCINDIKFSVLGHTFVLFHNPDLKCNCTVDAK